MRRRRDAHPLEWPRAAGACRTAAVLAIALLALAGASGGGATVAQQHAVVFSGLGFDTCQAPPVATLQAWLASPYRALGIYIGGANRACSNPQLTPSWVSSAEGLGWSLAPLYVGLQAPCSQQSGVSEITPATAASEGAAAGTDAVADASALGLPAGSPIYFDMEGYALDNPSCTQTVQTFLSSWVVSLHGQGYLAGVYGSAASTMRDVQALATTSASPDDIWIADWNGDTSVMGDPYVSDTLWTNNQRIHQFSGGTEETFGGVQLYVDSDSFDAAVVGGDTSSAPDAPSPTATGTPVASTLSAAGSVSTDDGVATVNWPAGAFDGSVVVSLTPSLPSESPPGFGTGGYGVELTVDSTATGDDPATFAQPLTIQIAPQAGSLAPVSSQNGTSWQALPELVGNLLPVGVAAAYAREPNGSFEIETRSAGYFALLPDSTPPPAPASLLGSFDHGTLVLRWPASTDAAGTAVAYQVSLTGQPLLTVTGQTDAALRAFHPNAPSVYRVTALDAAGNLSTPSPPLVVVPSKRPAEVPKSVPAWAWQLFDWQQQGRVGPRPAAPSTPPAWYWSWRAWRIAPFHVSGP